MTLTVCLLLVPGTLEAKKLYFDDLEKSEK